MSTKPANTHWRAPILVLLAFLAISPAAPAQSLAGDSVLPTTWHCWLDRSSRVLCQLEQAPPANENDPGFLPVSDLSVSSYPRRGPLPRIAYSILENPARFAGRTITIPLLSPPENMANAEELADAIMCGGRQACGVQFFRSVVAFALHLDEGTDPALY